MTKSLEKQIKNGPIKLHNPKFPKLNPWNKST